MAAGGAAKLLILPNYERQGDSEPSHIAYLVDGDAPPAHQVARLSTQALARSTAAGAARRIEAGAREIGGLPYDDALPEL